MSGSNREADLHVSLKLPPFAQRPFEGSDSEQEQVGERRLCACPTAIAA
jgi:hypothetical protein